MMKTGPTIIPIAGGKGGVGKTFLTANLSLALAEMGNRTVAVDMDLGGSNLYSYLGLSNRFPGIGDFLKARSADLEELLVSTESPNLQFLPGDGLTPFMANIPYAQKIRLITAIKRLPVEYILLDLGAGTTFNTLDFFRISRHGFVITTLEYPSIMRMLVFLKHFLLRIIERAFAKDRQIHDLMRSLYKQPMGDRKMSISVLRSRIDEINGEAAEKMTELCHKYRPRIIFNMGDHPDEIKIAEQISNSLESVLSLEVEYFGFIFYDPTVRESVKKRTTLLPHYRESMTAVSLKQIAQRIINHLGAEVKDSAQHLLDNTWKLYENRA